MTLGVSALRHERFAVDGAVRGQRAVLGAGRSALCSSPIKILGSGSNPGDGRDDRPGTIISVVGLTQIETTPMTSTTAPMSWTPCRAHSDQLMW